MLLNNCPCKLSDFNPIVLRQPIQTLGAGPIISRSCCDDEVYCSASRTRERLILESIEAERCGYIATSNKLADESTALYQTMLAFILSCEGGHDVSNRMRKMLAKQIDGCESTLLQFNNITQ